MEIVSENEDILSCSSNQSLHSIVSCNKTEHCESTVDNLNFDSLNIDSINSSCAMTSKDSFSTSTPKRNQDESLASNQNFIPSNAAHIHFKQQDETELETNEHLYFYITTRTTIDLNDQFTDQVCDASVNNVKSVKFCDIGALTNQLKGIMEIIQPCEEKMKLQSQGLGFQYHSLLILF